MGQKRVTWEDPFEFDGDAGAAHLTDWEDNLDEDSLADTREALSHEALSRLYSKTHKRGHRSQKRMRKSWQ